jgi:TPR repeat protein
MDICATADGGTDAKAYHTRKFTAALVGFQERTELGEPRAQLDLGWMLALG